jgi:hypothetical protein
MISAGNVGEGLTKAGYPARNEIEPIENPAQAWNAITVGAFAEKFAITDPTYEGWKSVAPVGDLCLTDIRRRVPCDWRPHKSSGDTTIKRPGTQTAQDLTCTKTGA